jgi:uncharacterized membrane protein (UPF0127 family)
MNRNNSPTPEEVQLHREKVKQRAKIARYIRIILYLGIAFMLFSRAKASTGPEVKFQVQTIKLGNQTLKVEIADDDKKRAQGLMNRTKLDEGRGMLFIFSQEQPLSFWMKNTLIPLTIGYFDKNQTLFQTVDMSPASPMDVVPPSYPSSRPGKYALEVPKGWFAKHKIAPGASFKFVDEKNNSTPARR